MSDHDAAPDPIDKAYVQAEAVLTDDETRAARRARVLGAIAREAETAPAAPLPLARRSAWRPHRWLAAAGVAGLGLILATQLYPGWRGPRTAQVGPAAPTPSASSPTANGPLPSPAVAPTLPSPPPPTAVHLRAPPPALVQTVPPRTVPPPASPPAAEPAASAPTPEPFPAAPAPAAPQQDSVIVTAERRSSREAMADQDEARAASPAPPTAAMSGFADRPADRAGLLRAAAAAGRTAEVKALLVQGVSVDAADANGKTALMEGIQADRPAVVALLLRHGASLDAEDNAGESARDMAAAKGDPALNQSLGLAP